MDVARYVSRAPSRYFSVRSGCSVMDLSPMEKYAIAGPDARRFLDKLVTKILYDIAQGF